MPGFSMYEGHYREHSWGGEVAVRQWGDHLVRFKIPSDELAVTKLEHVDGHTFARKRGDDEPKTRDDKPRRPYDFQIGDDGKTESFTLESGYYIRIE